VTQPPLDAGVARELAYRAIFLRLLQTLESVSIPVMPLKGVFLAYWVYEDPLERLGGDIDVLVQESTFDRAIQALTSAGFALKPGDDPRQRVLLASELPIEIDLHRALFAPGRYRLPTTDVFRRGKECRSRFAWPVVLPDPYDAVAHLVGHAASEHRPENAERNSRDLENLARKYALDPKRAATHLEGSGLARAARYTLGMVGTGSHLAPQILASLRRDPVGAVLSKVAAAVTRRFEPQTLPSRAAGHLICSSLPAAARTMMLKRANRNRSRKGNPPILY
jgi:hypothetical protein